MESNLILIREARKLLTGDHFDIEKAKTLAKSLKARNGFAYAAQLFDKLRTASPDDRIKYLHELAVCTYKDPDLPAGIKFKLAEKYLSEIKNPRFATDSEILGKLGAIYKQRWLFDNQFRHLLISRLYYERGYNSWYENHGKKKYSAEAGDYDAGYTAINFAFVLNLLAAARERITRQLQDESPASVQAWQSKAAEVRKKIVDYLDADKLYKEKSKGTFGKWPLATLGEAYFGLGRFEEAKFFYQQYGAEKLDLWQIDTTRKQLLALAQIHQQYTESQGMPGDTAATTAQKQKNRLDFKDHVRQCLVAISKPPEETESKELPVSMRGKVGLGLSGGGFRASLFHIGTLAKLAELDVLRHVEAISCVSGGSIVGAHYYLLLRKRLMAKYDETHSYMHDIEQGELQLTQADYIEIVQQLADDFLEGVQKNLAMRVVSGWQNLRIFLDNKYTRSMRIAELYEEHLYKKVFTGPDGTGAFDDETLLMHRLKITPRGTQSFSPKTDNWNRSHKVPTLVLNATSLNTGHNWQFTASWMGEPPANIVQSVDSKPRLRRMYYEEAPAPYTNNIRLGQAVGASSCVPALFEPLFFPGLYDGVDLRLVDGGVHDNQGIASLLEQECSILLLSDASGQLNIENAGSGIAGSFLRSDFVLQERARELQFLDLEARNDSQQLKGLMYIHLKKDLNKNPLKWKGCNDPTRHPWLTDAENPNSCLTQYGIQKSVQEKLANIRTSLDSFNDAESFALMYSAYRQTDWAFKEAGLDEKFPQPPEVPCVQWRFLEVAPFMEDASKKEPLEKRLDMGKEMTFAMLRVYGVFTWIKIALCIAAVAGTIWVAWKYMDYSIPLPALPVKTLVFIAAGVVIDMLVGFSVSRFSELRSFIVKKALLAVFALFLAGANQLYMRIFNPLYLRWGKIENLNRVSPLEKAALRVLDFLF